MRTAAVLSSQRVSWISDQFHGFSTKKISRDETEIIVVFHMYATRKMNYPGDILVDGRVAKQWRQHPD